MSGAPAPLNLAAGEAEILVAAVTYNSRDVIPEFVSSLRAALHGAPAARVVIVDNDSTDGTPDLVRSIAPWIELIDAGGNVGYAAGINLALQSGLPTHGAYILNPDAVPAPHSVKILLDAVQASPSIGITVPRMIRIDGSIFPSLRREPTILRALGEALLGGTRAGRHESLGEVVNDSVAYEHEGTADWATGAAMFIDRRTIDVVGYWDEQFFLYSEETDYALRARDAGLALLYVPGAEVRHLGGELGTSDGLWSLMSVNRVRLYRKRHGRFSSGVFWFVVTLGEGVRAAAGKRRSRAALRALLSGSTRAPLGSGETPAT